VIFCEAAAEVLADLEGRLGATMTLDQRPLDGWPLAAIVTLPIRLATNNGVGGLLAMRADKRPSLRYLVT
jgi:hypothetical protein